MILVPLSDPKFAIDLPHGVRELRVWALYLIMPVILSTIGFGVA